ncbi:hypothetical protein DDB_G0283693 [Dictyostelium discoideum AX4]|uniref:Uncharacterized protein n=1 Tax=Dictyostelium discoideum TaxID=44689 RepID=Q54QQ4_DICDI|nr:hypothetical protein DDB_G0283693 [Dictyostelium discoideum AX4]EAL65613.1 hypothetical protein DDB_G0283693 [Dictyostelium discoideum AX4]|eukprot:XP_638969.1 hypothetical protein DDB_G0283693 [Dictyostelium discoideum AX4]
MLARGLFSPGIYQTVIDGTIVVTNQQKQLQSTSLFGYSPAPITVPFPPSIPNPINVAPPPNK